MQTRTEIVDGNVADAVVDLVVSETKGPGEAYAILVLAIRKIFEINNEYLSAQGQSPLPLSRLETEFITTLRSIKPAGTVQ